jgi:hypothetical protein
MGRSCDREDRRITVSAVNTGRGALALSSVDDEAFYRPSVACSGARKGSDPMSLDSDIIAIGAVMAVQGLYVGHSSRSDRHALQ